MRPEEEFRRQGYLFCRMKYVRIWNNASKKPRVIEEGIVFLEEDECEPGHGIDAVKLRKTWRGETRLGGSRTPAFVDLTGDDDEAKGQYTFGDGFCVAGGCLEELCKQVCTFLGALVSAPTKAMNTYRLDFTAVGGTCEVAHFPTNDTADVMV